MILKHVDDVYRANMVSHRACVIFLWFIFFHPDMFHAAAADIITMECPLFYVNASINDINCIVNTGGVDNDTDCTTQPDLKVTFTVDRPGAAVTECIVPYGTQGCGRNSTQDRLCECIEVDGNMKTYRYYHIGDQEEDTGAEVRCSICNDVKSCGRMKFDTGSTGTFKDSYYISVYGMEGDVLYLLFGVISLAVLSLLIASIAYGELARRLVTPPKDPMAKSKKKMDKKDKKVEPVKPKEVKPKEVKSKEVRPKEVRPKEVKPKEENSMFRSESMQNLSTLKTPKDHTVVNIINDRGPSRSYPSYDDLESASEVGGPRERKDSKYLRRKSDTKRRRRRSRDLSMSDSGMDFNRREYGDVDRLPPQEAPPAPAPVLIVNMPKSSGSSSRDSPTASSLGLGSDIDQSSTIMDDEPLESVVSDSEPPPSLPDIPPPSLPLPRSSDETETKPRRSKRKKRHSKNDDKPKEAKNEGPKAWHEKLTGKFRSPKREDGPVAGEEDINRPVMGKTGLMDTIRYNVCGLCFRHNVYQEPKGWRTGGEFTEDNWNPMAEMVSREQESYISELSSAEGQELPSAAQESTAQQEEPPAENLTNEEPVSEDLASEEDDAASEESPTDVRVTVKIPKLETEETEEDSDDSDNESTVDSDIVMPDQASATTQGTESTI